MGGQIGPRRAFVGLRWTTKLPILSHMENFSTPRRALVPVTANLLTLLALVCTTWWSSHNRPVSAQQPPALMATRTIQTATTAKVAPALVQIHDDGANALAAGEAAQHSATLDRNGLRTVGYLADASR